ncbi:ATP-dependent DNA helicase RecG [Candidatus Dojkabacteria bacterium]|nr:ATP-dependent DNA helicase RecG [Candidatus Dojkabacteria bacterium]
MKLQDSIEKIPGIGPASAKKLANLDIYTVQDLLYHFPNYHHDFSQIVNISNLEYEKIKTIKVCIEKFTTIRLKGKKVKSMQKAKVSDQSGEIEVIWFNQPFLKDVMKENQEVYLAAKLNPKANHLQISNPEYEIPREKEATHLARITPVYSLTEGIKQKWLRSKIKWLIDKIEYINDLEETLPKKILEKFDLIKLKKAIRDIHFPKKQAGLKQSRKRLGFEELLEIQIKLEETRKIRKNKKGPKISTKHWQKAEELIESLTFKLTKDQKKALDNIQEDTEKKIPMYRLLHGDVGTGKTLVAIITTYATVKAGHKTAVMAPTTVLANQLYKEFSKYLEPHNIDCKLFTSNKKVDISQKSKKNLQVIIGTHSLLHQDPKLYSDIGLIIIDEQHRFGVEQRANLVELTTKGKSNYQPHYLMMTATPIPRTMAITFFGDMDLTLIKEKPTNKEIVETFYVPQKKRDASYNWVEERIKEGNQVFWICPLIEESDKLQTKSVKQTHKELKKIYPELKIKLLHGQIKEEEKNKLLSDFNEQEFDILVSTSVIEVGIDIPNANLIVIEGAERFGLAQLHQLRGRVGRHSGKAYCLLFASDEKLISQDAKKRLKYFASENDGLKISEYDLERRGPGEVYGTRQSGIPDLKIAKLTDIDLIVDTKKAAKMILG